MAMTVPQRIDATEPREPAVKPPQGSAIALLRVVFETIPIIKR